MLLDIAVIYAREYKWLTDEQFGEIEIECSAAELHFQNPTVEKFKIGQIVRCYSEPHFLEKQLPLQKMSIDLNSATKKITLGTLKRQKLTELYSQYPTADEVKDINYTVNDSKKRIVKVETDITDGFTISVSEPGGDGYVAVNIGIGNAVRTGRVLVSGNVDISGELSAEALYAAKGDIADLTVDQLCTSRRIARWLASDTSDDNYIHIKEEAIRFVSGTYSNGEVQVVNQYNRPLYWDSITPVNHESIAAGTVTLGDDGYPRINGKRVFTTTEPTTHTDPDTGVIVVDCSPVMVYTYDELQKAKFFFEAFYETVETTGDGTEGESAPTTTLTTYIPVLRFGAGDLSGHNYAYMRKSQDKFELMLVDRDGKESGLVAYAAGGAEAPGVMWFGSQAEYDQMVEDDAINPHTTYFIEGEDV